MDDEEAGEADDDVGDVASAFPAVAAAPRSGSSSPSSAAGTANERAVEAVAASGGLLMTSPGRRSRETSAGLARTSASGSTPLLTAMSVRVSPSRTSRVAGLRGSDERGMTTRTRGGAESGSSGGREGASRASCVRARLGRDEAWPSLGSPPRATRRSIPHARDDDERSAGRRGARLGVLVRAAAGERARGVPWCGSRGPRHRERGCLPKAGDGGPRFENRDRFHTQVFHNRAHTLDFPRASSFSPRRENPRRTPSGRPLYTAHRTL